MSSAASTAFPVYPSPLQMPSAASVIEDVEAIRSSVEGNFSSLLVIGQSPYLQDQVRHGHGTNAPGERQCAVGRPVE